MVGAVVRVVVVGVVVAVWGRVRWSGALLVALVVGRRAGGGVVDVLETLVVPVVAVDVMGPSVVVLFVVLAMVVVVHMLGRLDPKVGVNAREMIVVVVRVMLNTM